MEDSRPAGHPEGGSFEEFITVCAYGASLSITAAQEEFDAHQNGEQTFMDQQAEEGLAKMKADRAARGEAAAKATTEPAVEAVRVSPPPLELTIVSAKPTEAPSLLNLVDGSLNDSHETLDKSPTVLSEVLEQTFIVQTQNEIQVIESIVSEVQGGRSIAANSAVELVQVRPDVVGVATENIHGDHVDDELNQNTTPDEILYKLSIDDGEAMQGMTQMAASELSEDFQLAELVLPELEVGAIENNTELSGYSDEMVQELFDQLVEIDSNMVTSTTGLETDTTEPEVTAVNKFQLFVEAQPDSAEEGSLLTVQESAGRQPLEVVFVQLAAYLEKPVTDVELSEAELEVVQTVERLVTEIMAELEAVPVDYALPAAERQQLTPEITGKLMELLRTVGYENPQEVLIDFVSRYDIDYLLQAVRYLSLLLDENNRQEFAARSPKTASDDAGFSLAARLGRALLALIRANLEGAAVS